MINIYLNMEQIQVEAMHSLSDVLIKQGYEGTSFAVAVNQHFIPRAQYKNTFFREGDYINIVVPMQGG